MSDFEYEKKINDWEEVGTEPPAGSRKWLAGSEPPAAWFNYFWDGVIKSFTNIKTWINDHKDASGGVHGVAVGQVIETQSGAQNKVNTAISNHAVANNPHSHINGHALTEIFETNGTTVKAATNAVNASSAGSATKLKTARTIDGKVFDGTQNITTDNYRAGTSLTTYAYDGMTTFYARTVFTNSQQKNLSDIIKDLMKAAHKHWCSDHSDYSDDGDDIDDSDSW